MIKADSYLYCCSSRKDIDISKKFTVIISTEDWNTPFQHTPEKFNIDILKNIQQKRILEHLEQQRCHLKNPWSIEITLVLDYTKYPEFLNLILNNRNYLIECIIISKVENLPSKIKWLFDKKWEL